MANEKDLKIRLPVVPELDKRGTSNLMRDVARLEKDLGKVNLSYKELAKTSQTNVKELKNLSDGAASLGNKLSKAAQESYKKLGQTAKQIERARKKAAELEKDASKAGDSGDKGGQAKAQKEYVRVTKSISDMTKQLERQKKTAAQFDSEMKRGIKSQEKSIGKLKEFAKFSPGDALKGVLSGLGKAVSSGKNLSGIGDGLKEALGSAAKGAAGSAARGSASGAAAKGGAAGAGDMAAAGEAMGLAAGAIAGAVVAVGAIVKFIMMASDHMTGLNKALLKGTGLANDFGKSASEMRATVGALRTAAIDSAGSLMRFGLTSEKTLEIVNSFATASTGSLGQTKVMLKQMGEGATEAEQLKTGMEKFAQSAQVYGQALGISGAEVGKMMGDMVSDLGMRGDQALKTFDQIVKTAATSGMPVQKFMDVFHSVIPNIDMFTNRIEELTGQIKMLSKTMDPKSVKAFMNTMGKGFDQLDFKQRLKMAFVIGPAKVGKILEKDFSNAAKGLRGSFGSLADDMEAAMKSADPVKAMAAVAARAAAGEGNVQAGAIGKAQEMARAKANLNKGDVLHTATAMRSAGAYSRMNMLEEYAGKFTGGDIGGLGEHVAKQLGVSEEQYKAILALKDNMGMYQDSIKKTGRTGSKSMNDNLRKIWKQDKKQFSEEDKKTGKLSPEDELKFQEDMKKKSDAEIKDAVQQAAATQMDETKSSAESMEDLAAEQVNATTSLGDKLQSIVGYLLEKIFNAIGDILDVLNDVWNIFTSSDSDKAKQEARLKKIIDGAIVDETKNQAANILPAMAKGNAAELKKAWTPEMQKQSDELSTALAKTAGKVGQGPGQRDVLLRTFGPVIDKVGQMSSESAAKLQLPGGVMGQANTKVITDHLKAAEDAKAKGDTGTESRERAAAQKQFEDFVKNTGGEFGGEHAVQAISHAAALMTGEGMKVSLREDPNAVASALKKTKTQKDEEEAAKEKGDVDTDVGKELQKIAGGTGQVGAPTAGGAFIGPPAPPAANQLGVSDKDFKALVDAKTAGPAAAAGNPAAAGGAPAAAAKDQVKAQDQATSLAEKHVDTAEEQLQKQEQDYLATADVLSLLKKGIKFEQSWMNTKLKGMLDGVVLENLRTALLEQLVMQAKIGTDEDFKKVVAEQGWNIAHAQGATEAMLLSQKGNGKLGEVLKYKAGEGGYALGGYTGDGPSGQVAGMVHKGEFVVPQGGALVMKGGGGGMSVGTVNIHIQTNNPDEIRRVVDDMFNKGH